MIRIILLLPLHLPPKEKSVPTHKNTLNSKEREETVSSWFIFKLTGVLRLILCENAFNSENMLCRGPRTTHIFFEQFRFKTHTQLKEKKKKPLTTVMAKWQTQRNELPRMTSIKNQQCLSWLARPHWGGHVGQVQAQGSYSLLGSPTREVSTAVY